MGDPVIFAYTTAKNKDKVVPCLLSAGFLHEKSRFSENLKIEKKREIACNKPNRNYVFGLLHEISRLMLNSQFP